MKTPLPPARVTAASYPYDPRPSNGTWPTFAPGVSTEAIEFLTRVGIVEATRYLDPVRSSQAENFVRRAAARLIAGTY